MKFELIELKFKLIIIDLLNLWTGPDVDSETVIVQAAITIML